MPATNRTLDLRWFWKYDIAAGAEFRARLRLSNDLVTSVDLTNPVAEYNFTVSGSAADFEMFETMIALPNGVQSFDLTFISGGALVATGTIHIDDISAATVAALALPGDYNNNGIVDAADYVVWRKNEHTMNTLPNDPIGGTIGSAQYNTWRAHFGQTAGGGSSTNATVPEPPISCLLILGATAGIWRGRQIASRVPSTR